MFGAAIVLAVGAGFIGGPPAIDLASELPARLVSSSAAAPDAIAASRLHVTDGDTVRLGWERIRLLDIDAPEIGQAACRAERRAGERAKARLRQILTGRISIERRGRDPYGRTLARLRTASGDPGDILLREGLALPYTPGGRRMRAAHWCGGAE